MRAGLLTAVLMACASAAAMAADDRWIEVKSPHFTVVSNAGDKSARNVAWQFEQIRAAIQAGWPWARVQLDRPVMVVAAKDEASMKMLLPQYWEKGDRDSRPASVFNTSADRHFIAMRSDLRADDTEGINPYFASYWSYSALTLNNAFETPLPLWFRSGLAEVLSNSIVRDSEIQFGRAIPWHLVALQGARLRLSELIALDARSPYYTSGATRSNFDAQCWGVMHYMLFGRGEDRIDRVNQLATLLLNGKSSADAIQAVFGSVEALEQAYLQYQKKPISNYARLKVETNVASKDFPTRMLTAAELTVVRAALHGAMGRAADARALIADARKLAPEAPGSYDVEAMLLDREGKREDARTALAKAADLKSDSFYTNYRLAVLTWSPNPDQDARARMEQLLRRSIAINDGFAPAQAFLGDVMARGQRATEALAFATRAVQLDPGDSDYRLTLARVLWELSRRDDARAAALAGRSLARTDQQRSEAEELLTFFNRIPAK
ncbi:MAG TPA: tetratricopeptide repeat protein [Vicinamibacterales bacterium]